MAIGEVVKEKGILVYSDEVLRDSEFGDNKTVSFASLPGMQNHVVTSNSGSKTRGVANIRLGWACGPERIIGKIINYMEYTITDIPLSLQSVGHAVLKTPQDYLDLAREEYETRVRLIQSQVCEMNNILNERLGTEDVGYATIPFSPQAGHFIAINFDGLVGMKTSEGRVIKNSADLTAYFVNPDDPANGVLFSSGYSKGHDDCTLYISHAQPGFAAVNEAYMAFAKPRLAQAYINKSAEKPVTEDDMRKVLDIMGISAMAEESFDIRDSFVEGREVLREVLRRTMESILALCPVDNGPPLKRRVLPENVPS